MRAYVIRTEKMAERVCTLLRSTWKAQLVAGRPLEVVVSEFKKSRSHAQNRLYWRILETISGQVMVGGRRHQKEYWAEYFKRKFIGYEELPDGGQLGLSTTTLDAHQFSDYIGKIEAWAVADHGVIFNEED